jgi:hypothetical protein
VQVVDAKTHASLGYIARTVSVSVAQLLALQDAVRIECCITHTTPSCLRIGVHVISGGAMRADHHAEEAACRHVRQMALGQMRT